jgi:hypothetical protein
MPMPTGFSSKMPMKTACGYWGGGEMRENFTHRA